MNRIRCYIDVLLKMDTFRKWWNKPKVNKLYQQIKTHTVIVQIKKLKLSTYSECVCDGVQSICVIEFLFHLISNVLHITHKKRVEPTEKENYSTNKASSNSNSNSNSTYKMTNKLCSHIHDQVSISFAVLTLATIYNTQLSYECMYMVIDFIVFCRLSFLSTLLHTILFSINVFFSLLSDILHVCVCAWNNLSILLFQSLLF